MDGSRQLVDLDRAALALGLALPAGDPVLLDQVAHGDADFRLPEIGAALYGTGGCLRGVGQEDQHFCHVPLRSNLDEEVCKLLLFLRKIHHTFSSHWFTSTNFFGTLYNNYLK